MDNNREKLRELVRGLLEDQGATAVFEDAQPLISSGLLDSLAVIQIVVFMEREFDLDFGATYFDQSNFDSVEEMVAFVEASIGKEH